MRPELCFVGDSHLAAIYRQAAVAKEFTVHSDSYVADLVFLAQDVDSDGDLGRVNEMLKKIQLANDVPLIVLSQVPPGFTRTIPYEWVFYQVETLITTQGRSLECCLNQQRTIVGTFSGQKHDLPEAYKQYLYAFTNNVICMTYEAAEMAKAAINVFLASSIQTANRLAAIADRIGVKWDDIEHAVRTDPRIGPLAYVNPGVFGPHLQRDWDRVEKLSDTHARARID